MSDQIRVKEEIIEDDNEDMDLEEEEPTLGPAALGLQRVGAPVTPKASSNTPVQVLNARGMPARIRKKNKFFFDDDIVNTPHHRVPSAKKQKPSPATRRPRYLSSSPTKSPRPYPSKRYSKDYKRSDSPPPMQSPDRKVGQKIGLRLRNLLKLPKAHRWVCCEWFYSDIDKCLFFGENDFSICLKESFPELKTHDLTRTEWTKIRRMMGKPRRCSQAFFNEERLELEKKRKKIRALQQRKATDISTFVDLPPEIPWQLVIGTKVTARLRKPQEGLFTGTIDAVDTSNNTYRVTFERQGLGTHSVPDYEVLSNEPPETISISSFVSKQFNRARTTMSPYSPVIRSPPVTYSKHRKDPLLSGVSITRPIVEDIEGRIGGFPVKLLERIVLITKILGLKKSKVIELRNLNNEAERNLSYENEIADDFQKKYASTLIDLERLNRDLQMYLDEIQVYCQEIAPEPSIAAMLAPSHLREKCREEAIEIVEKNNNNDRETITNETIINLITELTALMLQVKSLADSDQNAYELKVLQGTMEQIKIKLNTSNKKVFEDSIEVHMRQIQIGLGQAQIERTINLTS